jgi:hypothetical protein
MRQLIITALFTLLLAAPALGGITNNGDGTSTLWFCSSDANAAKLVEALRAFSEDEGGASAHALAMLALRDLAEITVGDGAADTGYCGVLAVGRSEWRITVSNALAGSFQTAVTDQAGWTDVDPADGLDDNTGLTRQQTLDAALKEGLKSFTQRRYNLDHGAPPTAGDFDDDPS